MKRESAGPERMARAVIFLLFLGVALAVTGWLLRFAGRIPFLSWMGRLPGDIRIEGDRSAFYFPIATCLIISLALSLLFRVLRALLPRL